MELVMTLADVPQGDAPAVFNRVLADDGGDAKLEMDAATWAALGKPDTVHVSEPDWEPELTARGATAALTAPRKMAGHAG